MACDILLTPWLIWGVSEARRVHHASRQRGDGRAARCARAAAGGAGDRVPQWKIEDEASGDTAAFHQGLNETGYLDGRNVAPEYRWGEGWNELLPALAQISSGGTEAR